MTGTRLMPFGTTPRGRATPIAGRSFVLVTLLSACLATAGGCRFDPSGLSPFGREDAAPYPDGTFWDSGGPCTPGEERCQGASLQMCVSEEWQNQQLCEWGCVPTPDPHCGQPRFANGVTLASDAGSDAYTFPAGISIIDTNSGVITLPTGDTLTVPYKNRHTPQVDGPGLRVIGFLSLTIPSGATVRVQGTSALAIVTREDLLISGTLEALGSASNQPSAGGYAGGSSGNPGQGPGAGESGSRKGSVFVARGGGGGAGCAATGGTGGTGDDYEGSASGGAGGAALPPSALSAPEPLVGGSGGGGGGDGGTGGSGGGALQLCAGGAVEIQPTGAVNVGGGGGGANNSGGGGGSGGMALIQCRATTIAGVLAANGGGGGGAGDEGPGSAGLATDTATPGGGDHAGLGGAGENFAGTPGTQRDSNGGGGGGAAGRLLVQSFVAPSITGLVSPHEGTDAFFIGVVPTE